MKNISLKTKIALWVSVLVLITALASSAAVIAFGNRVVQQNARRSLITAVEGNINEIEIYTSRSDVRLDDEFDVLVEDGKHFIEIDDDFIKETNGVTTTLYSNSSVLYGDNIIDAEAFEFNEKGVRIINSGGESYYVYDKTVNRGVSGELWLRGTVSRRAGLMQTLSVVDSYLLIIPLMIMLAVGGAFILARRALSPIESIARSADEIQQGNDLTNRIELTGKSVETDTLINSFNGMLERLEGSFERERRFNSDISHELRTPVSVILSASELALEETDEAQYIESLEIINRQGEKMRKMINEMLELSRLGSGTPEFRATDFSTLVRNVCDDFKLIEKKGITLDYGVEDGINVLGNAGLLSRLCENLISNAYSYGKENGSIRVSLKSENGFAVLSVKDDGVGISPQDKDKIFNAFYRADSSRSDEGFGLGLNFVKTIAVLHGGEVNVNSIVGVGSEFVFKIKIS